MSPKRFSHGIFDGKEDRRNGDRKGKAMTGDTIGDKADVHLTIADRESRYPGIQCLIKKQRNEDVLIWHLQVRSDSNPKRKRRRRR